MPTFCRHGRFLERCPICSKTLAGRAPDRVSAPRVKSPRSSARGAGAGRGRARAAGVHVRREGRAEEDGFRSELVPGVRASADALRLVEELSFAAGRLAMLAGDPPGLYGEARQIAQGDLDRATWTCLLIAYLSPLEGEEPFSGIRSLLARAPTLPGGEELGELEDELDGAALGPRSSHDPARGAETLRAYLQWVDRTGGGSQATALTGDPGWSPERRFERMFERLALPGFGRVGRYELLVTLGRLGCYELRPDSLHLSGGRGPAGEDLTTVAAKRVFGIGDGLLLDRRAGILADAVGVPVEALDLALANWASPRRATVGVPAQTSDDGVYERAGVALGL